MRENNTKIHNNGDHDHITTIRIFYPRAPDSAKNRLHQGNQTGGIETEKISKEPQLQYQSSQFFTGEYPRLKHYKYEIIFSNQNYAFQERSNIKTHCQMA